MRIAIDIDGTITRADAFIPFINDFFKMNFTGKDITSYDFSGALGVDVSDLFNQTDDTMYRSLAARQYAPAIIQDLHTTSDVHLVTARPKRWAEATRYWLNQHNIPVKQLSFHGGDEPKKQFLSRLQPHVVIEDNPGIALFAVEELGVPVILLDAPYNQSCLHPSIHRVTNWKDLKRIVSNL